MQQLHLTAGQQQRGRTGQGAEGTRCALGSPRARGDCWGCCGCRRWRRGGAAQRAQRARACPCASPPARPGPWTPPAGVQRQRRSDFSATAGCWVHCAPLGHAARSPRDRRLQRLLTSCGSGGRQQVQSSRLEGCSILGFREYTAVQRQHTRAVCEAGSPSTAAAVVAQRQQRYSGSTARVPRLHRQTSGSAAPLPAPLPGPSGGGLPAVQRVAQRAVLGPRRGFARSRAALRVLPRPHPPATPHPASPPPA